nr:DNA polymerase [Wolbachia endosymbiont of Atemnus politus]
MSTVTLTAFENNIYDLAGERINIASPKQLGEVLFNKMGLNNKRKSKSRSYSTNSEVLEEIEMEELKLQVRF